MENLTVGYDSSQVEVVFWTRIKDEKLKAPENSFMIESNMGRSELSELLNTILGTEKYISFDFIIDEIFLRSNILEYMKLNGKTSESLLKIEYVFTLGKPSINILDKHSDWIRSITMGLQTDNPMAIVGYYDGIIRFYDTFLCSKEKNLKLEDNEKKSTFEFDVNKLLEEPTSIMNVKAQQLNDSEYSKVWASTINGSIIALNYSMKNECILKALKLKACNAPIEALSPIRGCESIVSVGDANGTISIYLEEESEDKDFLNLVLNKKLKQHSSNITDLMSVNDYIFSTSLDGNIKLTQVSIGEVLCGWNLKYPAFSISAQDSFSGNVICTSHDDGKVRIWDIRAGNTSQVDLKVSNGLNCISLDNNTRFIHRTRIIAHKEIIPQAQWSPFNKNMIGSISHDMSIKLLDIRSPDLPLQVAKTNSKLLSLSWVNENTIYTGGSTGELIISTF